MKTFDIIPTEKYLLAVAIGENLINKFTTDGIKVYEPSEQRNKILSQLGSKSVRDRLSEIIAHLPLNGSPVLEGVYLLPELEDVLDKAVIKHLKERFENSDNPQYFNGTSSEIDFRAGYKAAGGWNDNDIFKAVELAHTWSLSAEDVLKKLKQSKLPVAWDSETKQYVYE